MGTGIITAAILLIIGYVVITRLIGLAFRLVVPVVLLMVLAGAGLFTGLMPDRGPDHYAADQYRHDGHHRGFQEDGGRLGDMRLRDIADSVIDTARSILRGTLAFLDRADNPRSPEPMPHADRGPTPRDRADEARSPSYDDPSEWDAPYRPGRVY
ncbi:hypothetical protein [Microvirga sp. 2TAF3]|uniref:hypothetical protein n=1 Tax=Microvirga sp. 2TAF3 TaxID=3233014 RepID=UPI003F95FD35